MRPVLVLASFALCAADWPGFLGPNHDLTSPERGVVWPPKYVWTVLAGEGYTGPAVVGNSLFLFDRVGNDGRVRALRVADGSEIWHFTYQTDYVDKYGYDGGPRTSPVVAKGRVYVYGPEGTLIALDANTGKQLWRVDTFAKYGVIQNFFGAGSTPWVEGQLLIAAVGGSPPGPEPDDFRDLKGNGSTLVAFDAATGAERWKCGTDLAAYSSPFVIEQNGKPRGYYFARSGLLAFDPVLGKIEATFAWRAPMLESANCMSPVVAGGRVFISESYALGSALLRTKPGGFDVIWSDKSKERNQSLQAHWARPILVGDHLYACSGRNSSGAELRCLELATGTVKWREPGLGRTTLIGVDGHLLVLSEFGLLLYLKVNPVRYDEVGRVDLGVRGERRLTHNCWAAPVLANGRVYIRGKDQLVCLDLIPKKDR